LYPTLDPTNASSQSFKEKCTRSFPTAILFPPYISNIPLGNNPPDVDSPPSHGLPSDACDLFPWAEPVFVASLTCTGSDVLPISTNENGFSSS